MTEWSNVPTARVVVSPKVVASGLLLRVGISGAAVAVWGAAMLASAATSATTAIVALLGGIAVAILSLRKAWSMLELDGEGGAGFTALPRRGGGRASAGTDAMHSRAPSIRSA